MEGEGLCLRLAYEGVPRFTAAVLNVPNDAFETPSVSNASFGASGNQAWRVRGGGS